MKLFHGTSSKKLEKIKTDGLTNPYLTDNYDIAAYYARETSDGDESSPIVIEVDVNEDFLL
jgi:hypothetical protein